MRPAASIDSIDRTITYARQRGITVDHMGAWGITHKLTARQQNRIRRARRRYWYGKRSQGTVPF